MKEGAAYQAASAGQQTVETSAGSPALVGVEAHRREASHEIEGNSSRRARALVSAFLHRGRRRSVRRR